MQMVARDALGSHALQAGRLTEEIRRRGLSMPEDYQMWAVGCTMSMCLSCSFRCCCEKMFRREEGKKKIEAELESLQARRQEILHICFDGSCRGGTGDGQGRIGFMQTERTRRSGLLLRCM